MTAASEKVSPPPKKKHLQSHFEAQRQNILNRLRILAREHKEGNNPHLERKGQEERYLKCGLTMDVLFMQAVPKYRSRTASFIHKHMAYTHSHTDIV